MKQSVSFYLLVFLSIFYLFNPASAEETEKELWEKAKKIHDEAIVIDAHAHPMVSGRAKRDNLDLGKKTEMSQVDFISMKEGGLDAVFLALPLGGDVRDKNKPSEKIFDDIELIRSQVKKYSNIAELALTPVDIRRIHGVSKRAVLFGIECLDYQSTMEGNTAMLEAYYKIGVRIIVLTHTAVDRIANSESNDPGESGLSPFGKKVIKELNRLGMLIDITHNPDNLQLDIIKESKAPVVVSHSCARAIVDIPRCIHDEILIDIAKKGGVVMISFYSDFLSNDYRTKLQQANEKLEVKKKKLEEKFKNNMAELDKQLKALEEKLAPERVSIDVMIDHIDHVVKVAGVDHVGVCSDYGVRRTPIGLETAAGYSLITYHLLKRGYKVEDIRKIMGSNVLRVFEEAQKISDSI